MNDLRKSMLDLAEEQFNNSKEPIKFAVLWENIVKAFDMTEEEARTRLPLFYTSLSMDGRFVVLTEDLWDLKAKHAYDEVHPDINDIYNEEEEDSNDDAEEQDEDDELDEKKASKKSKSDDDELDEEDDEEDK